MRPWPTSKVSACLSPGKAPWLLYDSASFLPAFSLVFPTYLSSALSTGQGSFFIHQWYSQHAEGNPTSAVFGEVSQRFRNMAMYKHFKF